MDLRFTSNLVLASVGGSLATASLTFGSDHLGWIALGAGAAACAVAAVAFPGLTRGAAQRRLDVLAAVLGVWTVVASRVLEGHVLRWTTFGGAAGLAGLAALGLVLHELDQQRRLAATVGARDAAGHADTSPPLAARRSEAAA